MLHRCRQIRDRSNGGVCRPQVGGAGLFLSICRGRERVFAFNRPQETVPNVLRPAETTTVIPRIFLLLETLSTFAPIL